MPVSANLSGSASAGPATVSYSTRPNQDTRMILAFLFFSGVLALAGYEKKNAQGKKTVSPAEIVLGGTVGAVTLTLLSHAGEGGRKFAVGLAGITFASSILINGSSLFTSINALVGQPNKASKPSTPSTPSTPTSGVKSATVIAPVALGGL